MMIRVTERVITWKLRGGRVVLRKGGKRRESKCYTVCMTFVAAATVAHNVCTFSSFYYAPLYIIEGMPVAPGVHDRTHVPV